MSPLKIHNLEGKVVGSVKVPEKLIGQANTDILWQAIRMYRACQRQGTAKVKTRAEVSGGGKKPWKQKHTGRARAGSSRSPIWVGGGVAWGPAPREYRYTLPKQIRRRALLESLKDRFGAGSVTVVETLEGISHKTKALAGFLQNLKIEPPVLLVPERSSPILHRISRNLPKVMVKPVSDLTCSDVLTSLRLVVTAEAFKRLEGLGA